MRCIHYANDNGSVEGVYFTEDTDMDAGDVLSRPDCKVINDFHFDDGDFPGNFPTDTNLEKKN